ncbi:MAG: D-alanyl-D-alanine dipeptidase [Candidatus Falkowbacteria bacterium GW2011_GWC2_38_22]|uniref:D-alanyl-D-alanine dipeptidase n=1 Tax=Candidatus Falkowbacteria bacterium GW2011_GWE1_38_31 TaxID=1618638 RepID=A0A0G0MBW2_9BACT|nr:MAG: D-alanyl-D-alanine dipeptidase [Candidatus Falkowbacteria bacterium GW2011_GWF2_38_1205]KKQ61815.1 MAG: D-alanyl-D-alanine dipeptidase [Candidatus Falkowbacteria bacterium GW2011_GWC2_38_22]KKQ64123.1 MAG: D-alanyl-D-alanine dipeptidase [Candidatus Falkowbacteria bacterium GW2011_GWF1_38_22]KKQ66527.1 MAG: D-alanyl-D-alanine dipeptidase [Candidatus Falkowbacteria bacterium GW2011_GWE2_38_254]KKQ71229.1 MAG: D-alanyl-D-alanine dipeptidase [Candidatus Falkowbacteria bacterium GW2011_GWE1_
MDLKIAKYCDLKKTSVIDNNEEFVIVNKYDRDIKQKHFFKDMLQYFDGQIVVRKTVAKKLAKVNFELKKLNKNYTLLVSYGYRLLKIQKEYFSKELEIVKNENKGISKDKLFELVHKKIAVPIVAGHPTGGAVDLTIFDTKNNILIDMGGDIADFSNKRVPTFNKYITKIQEKNRKILLELMLRQNFCPFYEEWWHFSYGDKEWAFFYEKENAIYEQLAIKKIKIKLK